MHEGKHSLMHSKKISVHCRFCTECKFKLSFQQATEHQHTPEYRQPGPETNKKNAEIKITHFGAHFITSLGTRGDVCSGFH